MIITHKLEMDLQQRGSMPEIDAVQGDANTRVLELTLHSGGEAWSIPEDAMVWMRYCKSDGTKGVYDTLPDGSCAWSAQDNVLTVALAPQMLTAAGAVLAQVLLVQGMAEIATFTIRVWVERNPAAGDLQSEHYMYMMQWLEEELQEILQQVKDSGAFTGPQGPQGEQGRSAYDYAVEAGFQGTEAEFAQMQAASLSLSGGTMKGTIDMGGHGLTNLAEPVEEQDAATRFYVDSRIIRDRFTAYHDNWTETAPYLLFVTLPAVLPEDWIRLKPVYADELETDIKIKAAFDCISYVRAEENGFMLVCLENKPEGDLELCVEAVHGY